MRISIQKLSNFSSEYTILRRDDSTEKTALETKTYLIHDLCHFVLEKKLKLSNGFWGMLSRGYSFNEMSGKNNPQTAELRFIEQIIGPIQSLYSGYIPKQDFGRHMEHLDFKIPEEILTACLAELKTIMEDWNRLSIGETLTLEWNEPIENGTGFT